MISGGKPLCTCHRTQTNVWKKQISDNYILEAIVDIHDNATIYFWCLKEKWTQKPTRRSLCNISLDETGKPRILYFGREQLIDAGLKQPMEDALREFIDLWIAYSTMNM